MDIASSLTMPAWRTLDDASKQLKISRRTLTRWIKAGHIRVYMVLGDRHRYVDLDEIKKARQPRLVQPPE